MEWMVRLHADVEMQGRNLGRGLKQSARRVEGSALITSVKHKAVIGMLVRMVVFQPVDTVDAKLVLQGLVVSEVRVNGLGGGELPTLLTYQSKYSPEIAV